MIMLIFDVFSVISTFFDVLTYCAPGVSESKKSLPAKTPPPVRRGFSESSPADPPALPTVCRGF